MLAFKAKGPQIFDTNTGVILKDDDVMSDGGFAQQLRIQSDPIGRNFVNFFKN
jgi:hypothetical protein